MHRNKKYRYKASKTSLSSVMLSYFASLIITQF
jgi:hypothetical protein